MKSGATLVLGLNKVLEGLSGVCNYIDDTVVYNQLGGTSTDIERIVSQAEKS